MSNVDATELSKFDQLADSWWDLNGKFKALHDINPLRVDYIEQQVGGLFGKEVLDVGCGGGILSEALAQRGAKVTGLDMVEASLNIANLHKLESGLEVDYTLSTAEDWARQKQDHYDVITCLEMLEHVPHPESIVKACADMVKIGGYVIFSTINKNPKAFLMAILGAEYLLNMVPKGTHDYKKFIRPSDLVGMIDNTNLQPFTSIGLHFNPILNTYYLSEKNIDVNYFIVCKKTN